MAKRMNRNIDIKSRRVQQSVSKLDGFLRAEYNSEKNYLEYYAGLETLDKVISIKDQIIYGRRGTGKTHLLKALQEKLLADDQKYLPVYIDLRTFKPTLESDNDLYYALIIFQEIVVEVLKCVYVNLDYLYQEYTVEQQKIIIDPQRRKISALLEKFNRNFDGKSFTKMGETGFRVNEVKKLATNLKIAKIPELFGSKEVNKEIESEDEKIKYISFSDMSDAISQLLEAVDIDRIFCLLDEWSEIPETSQYILAEFLKRTFVPKKVTLKIAAIPNRTQLISENRIGLEDGGDIFGYPLDNRYIYELYPEITKAFFNELLYKQLYLMDGKLDATEEAVIRAAKLANAHDFIMRLPDGYQTQLKGSGSSLSQGQRQLLAIARVAVADPPVLILDEATSSIDTRTEKIVQDGMDRLMKGRTVFVIAHRLSTIRNSDVIMVLDHGRIVERGDHESLLTKKGMYYQLYTGKERNGKRWNYWK